MTETKTQEKSVEKRAKKAASYHVLKLVELLREADREVVEAWVHLTDRPIQAVNRKAAVKIAVEKEPEGEKGGTYRAIPAEQVQDLKLRVEQTTTHAFT